MSIPVILGISGVRGSGKSLLGNYMEEYGYEKLSLAEWLKQVVMRDFRLNASQVYGNDKETPTKYIRTNGAPLTGRDILIRAGVYYRSIDPLFFCKKLESYLQDGRHYVIDDIRFVNEVQFFKEHYGAKFVRIERLPELNIYKAALDDLSETELNTWGQWDFQLPAVNNQTPDDLKVFASVINSAISQ